MSGDTGKAMVQEEVGGAMILKNMVLTMDRQTMLTRTAILTKLMANDWDMGAQDPWLSGWVVFLFLCSTRFPVKVVQDSTAARLQMY